MTPVDDPDLPLLTAWRGGDRSAAEVLIDRHYDSIAGFFRTKAARHAEDLVQRTFLRCAERLAAFRAEGTVRAFFFGVARAVLFEHLRAMHRDGPAPDFHTSSLFQLGPGPATLLGRDAEERLLVAALQRLPVELQVAIELHYWEELSMEELGQVLEVPPGTVKSRLHRARQLLREAMAQIPSSPEARDALRTKVDGWLEELKEELPAH